MTREKIFLRDYQLKGIAEICSKLKTHNGVLYTAPTGAGKTVMFAFLAQEMEKKRKRVTILVHRRELINQTKRIFDALKIPYGIIATGYKANTNKIQIASVFSISKRKNLLASDIIIVDEAHHAVSESWSKYLNSVSRTAKIIGFTATPLRLDKIPLSKQFDYLINGPTIKSLVKARWITPLDVYAPTKAYLDLKRVTIKKGDYDEAELNRRALNYPLYGEIIHHYKQFADNRKTLAYCVSIEHAEFVAELFNKSGIPARNIDSRQHAKDIDKTISNFRNGKIQILTSCDLISEGFDVPDADCCLLLRPTLSLAIYLQQVGRIMRKGTSATGIVLDHAGNSLRHGPPDLERIWSLMGSNIDNLKSINPTNLNSEASALPRQIVSIPANLVLYRSAKEQLRCASSLKETHQLAKALGYSEKWAEIVYKIREAKRAAAYLSNTKRTS
jgi:superfamily II DNA or RNA helicase